LYMGPTDEARMTTLHRSLASDEAARTRANR
jgi:hypothetical protein